MRGFVNTGESLGFLYLIGSDELEWIANPMYDSSHLICKSPSDYISLDIRKGVSIYRQFEENPEIFLYVPNPALKAEVWRDFEP